MVGAGAGIVGPGKGLVGTGTGLVGCGNGLGFVDVGFVGDGAGTALPIHSP